MSKTPLSDIYGGAQNYFQLQSRYLQLKYARLVTDLVNDGLKNLVMYVLGSVAALFFSFALAFWFGKLLHSLPAGFCCVGAFYLLALIAWFIVSSRRSGAFKDNIVRKLDLGIAGYDELLKEQAELKPKLDSEKEDLHKKLEELKAAIAGIEEKFGGNNTKTEDKSGQGVQVGQRVLSTAVNLLLETFVLPKAGLVKRAVLPVVVNAVMRSGFFKSGKLGSLISKLRGKN